MKPLNLTRRNRAVVALLIGCAYAALAYVRLRAEPRLLGRDFTYSWLGAKFLLAGQNPYVAMATAPSPYPGAHAMFYPLPAAVLALPTVWLSAQLAAAVFVALGASFLAYAVTARGWWRLWITASAPAYIATQSVQWSLLLTAGALVPGALGLVAAKPNLALPLAAYQRRWRDVIYGVVGGLVLVFVALMFRLDWISNWLAMFGSSPLSGQYKIPILSPWGCWIALAALRWRDRDARLVLMMACAPQTSYLYDQLPLLLVARTRMQQVALALTSWCAYVLFLNSDWHANTWNEYSSVRLPYVVLGLYLPALLIVLWPRQPGSKEQRVPEVSHASEAKASIEARAS